MKLCNCDQKIRERFDAKVLKTTSCWLWQGDTTHKGYGVAWVQRKQVRAHRLAYFFKYGEFDESLLVLHKCDVRSCVRPDHLFLGTPKDNVADMIKKGRARWQKA